MAIRTENDEQLSTGPALLNGLIAGLMTAVPLIGLILLTVALPTIRNALVNVSPELIDALTFGQGPYVGSLILAAVYVRTGPGRRRFPPFARKSRKATS